MMLVIKNDGQAIASTTYWESDWAQNGLVHLSVNAGAVRVLLPSALEAGLSDMRAAHAVVISRGAWVEQAGRDGLEVMFDDGSASPYCLHLSAEQCDRALPSDNQGGGFVVTVWTHDGGEVLRLPGKYRIVDQIPCLDPWVEQ